MARKPRKESTATISTGLHARIVRLSELVWGGNRSQMGRDLGVDQSAISKVLAGKQEPSAKLLEKLASHPRVNSVWLFTGVGEPLIEGGLRPGVGGYCPLLDELLPGPLAEHRDRLSGVSYPVASPFDTPTSYWYRVPANTPVTISDHKVQGGDLFLIETDPTWTHKSAAVLGKFCGFPVKKGKKEAVELWWVDAYDHSTSMEGYEQYRVDTFKQGDKTWLIVPLDANGEENARQSLDGVCLTLDKIVCVGVKLERPFVKNIQRDTQHTHHTHPE